MVYISLIVACGYYFKKRLALAQGIMAVGASIGMLLLFDIVKHNHFHWALKLSSI